MTLALAANHVWQSTLFALAIWVLTQGFRSNSAAIRHRLWLAASAKFLLPLAWVASLVASVPIQNPILAADLSGSVASISAPFASALPAVTVVLAHDYAAVLFTIWMLGSALCLLQWWYRWWRLRVIVAAASPLNLSLPIPAKACEANLEPGVFGVLRPILLIPAGLCTRLTPAQFDALIAHEMCHVRRRDNLAMALHLLVEALFWFHPLVWWIEHRLLEEQERACDEGVLRNGTRAETYAQAILTVCALHAAPQSSWMSRVSAQGLTQRIEDIMSNRPIATLSVAKKLLLVICGAAVLIGAVQATPTAAWTGTWRMDFDATQFPDASGRRIEANPYRNGLYILRMAATGSDLRITRESQPNGTATLSREEVVVSLDGRETAANETDAPGRTVSFRSSDRNSFEIIRRSPRPDGTIATVIQRYVFSSDGKTMTSTWHADNPARAWQIAKLVFIRD